MLFAKPNSRLWQAGVDCEIIPMNGTQTDSFWPIIFTTFMTDAVGLCFHSLVEVFVLKTQVGQGHAP